MGGRPPDVEDKDILEILADTEKHVLFTTEVAEELPIGRQGTLQRLNEFTDRGLVNKRKKGSCVVWWISEDGTDFLENEDS